MKKQLLIIILTYLAFLSSAQYVNIPDNYLKLVLMQRYPACFNSESQLDTTCSAILNETTLNIKRSGAANTDGIQYFKNLKVLICSQTYVNYIPKLPNTLVEFRCDSIFGNIYLRSLPPLPSTLKKLTCHTVYGLNCLPQLPEGLEELVLSDDMTLCIPNKPANLKVYNFSYEVYGGTQKLIPNMRVCNSCDGTYITIPDSNFRKELKAQYPRCFNAKDQIDSSCYAIKEYPYLYCPSASITNLEGVQYLSRLKSINCSNNQLSKLPQMPQNLTSLNCSNNQLKELPSLPESLTELYCNRNQLKTLPELPKKLLYLECSDNLLSNFPSLPDALIGIYCDSNKLTILPKLPPNLEYLSCNYNQLTQIGPFRSFLARLRCSNNLLKSITTLPISVWEFNCSSNPDLHCLPTLPKHLRYLTLTPSTISCLPNKLPYLIYDELTTPEIKGMPICDDTNRINNCQLLPFVRGKVFIDVNQNNKLDPDEVGMAGVKVWLYENSYTISDKLGNYVLTADGLGQFELHMEAPSHYSIYTSSVTVNLASNSDRPVINLGLKPEQDVADFSLDLIRMTNSARPGFCINYQINYQNTGIKPASPTITFYYDTAMLKIDSVSVPFIQGKSSAIINIPSLSPGENDAFVVYAHIERTARMRDSLKASVSLVSSGFSTWSQSSIVITGSYDPNDKQGTTNLSVPAEKPDQYIDYTIRFQNTGNDTAFTIVVVDTLSPLLQSQTLQLVSASHTCRTSIKNNIVSFEFPNILLLDSNRNEKASHGYLHFKILPKTTVNTKDTISNTAYIYFDYNAPVVTNTVSTSFSGSLLTDLQQDQSSSGLRLFPNPAHDKLTLTVPHSAELSIFNAMGHLVLRQWVSGTQDIDVRALNKGLHYYSIGDHTGKFIHE